MCYLIIFRKIVNISPKNKNSKLIIIDKSFKKFKFLFYLLYKLYYYFIHSYIFFLKKNHTKMLKIKFELS